MSSEESVGVDLEQPPKAEASVAEAVPANAEEAETFQGKSADHDSVENGEAEGTETFQGKCADHDSVENGQLQAECDCHNEKPVDANGLPVFTSHVHSNSVSENNAATCVAKPRRNSAASIMSHLWERRVLYAEIALLIVAILTVWGLLTLPTIFYFGVQEGGDDEVSTTYEINTFCTAEVYTGEICRDHLRLLQDCSPSSQEHNRSTIFVPSGANEREGQARQFIAGLAFLNPSPTCRKKVVPFLCFYIIGLCDATSNKLRLPSQGQCLEITEDVCREEFARVASSGFEDRVPQCRNLPLDATLNCSNGSLPVNETEANTTTDLQTTTLNCSDGFYGDTACRPQCGKWEQLPHGVSVTADVLVILSTCIYLIAGAVLLVLSCLRYRSMFSYPSVFIVYQTLTLGLFELFVLIGFTDRESLYCSSKDLQESVENPSTFCEAIGVVFHYTSLQAGMWWLFHVTSLFLAVKCPTSYKQWEKKHYLRYVHLTLVLVGLILPVIPVIVISSTDGYTLPRFPPFTCSAADPDASYFTLVLFNCIYLAIGVPVMLVLFWTLVKLIRSKTEKGKARLVDRIKALLKDRSHQIMRTQIKLFIILCYYIIFGVVGLTSYSAGLHARKEREEDLIEYFVCEARGSGNECSKSEVSQLDIESLIIVSFILTGIYPLVSLIYVIQLSELKQRCCWWRRSSYFVSSSGYRSNHSHSVHTPHSTKDGSFKFGRNGSISIQSPPAHGKRSLKSFAVKSPFTRQDSALYSPNAVS